MMPQALPTAISAGSSCLRRFLLLSLIRLADLFFFLFPFDAFTIRTPDKQ